MTDIFTTVAEGLGIYIGGTAVAGFLLGFALIFVILVGLVFMFGTDILHGMFVLVVVGFVIAFVTLVGWWPLWTVLAMACFVMAAWLFGRLE